MTNEELVAEIQSGREDLYVTLWEQVERFAAWKANRVIRILNGRFGVDFEDLYHSCYPAMLQAVKTYTPGSCAFSTWFMYYIKTAFSDVTGNRTVRSREDPLQHATSLATPIGGEDNDGTLADIIADPQGQLSLSFVEARILYKQMQKELSLALQEIPEDCREVLTQRYYQQKTHAEVGLEMGKTTGEIKSIEERGIRVLRQPRIAKRLQPLYDEFDFYSMSGINSFRNSGMSVQERYVISLEKTQRK